mmetsp:Transcript_28923/g.50878  ORF Transcript_28923/g.50878 Transcript_28923/m.50878 type:complete len:185 (+) Transcript_28923:135-689(+)|eukprot:CAMPEP_0197530642 /NCGR_PEP_ID=MMETSP1318-20131121/32502_1 /TAXON_ID=552666 /ORGANISM="Partenskyella glossopodia, Strain RCC365" /LENGTH=184 /DNA_ID=CAMNT_0043086555 /DNA_START=42 /DNA_END=596 /DNA_ORIENTATION=-
MAENKDEGVKCLNVIPNLWFDGDCKKALEFYAKALPCKVAFEMELEGTIVHASLLFGKDTNIFASDVCGDNPERGARCNCSAAMYCYVDDCDKAFAKAVAAGCKALVEPADQFWGERMGKVQDPFGHTWAFSTKGKQPSKEELQKGQAEWWASMKQKRKRVVDEEKKEAPKTQRRCSDTEWRGE